MTGPLALPFPMPDTVELSRAFRELNLAVNGDEATKKRIGNPAFLPRPWDPPTCNKPALRRELWDWLDAVVTWFNQEYVWDPAAGMIPPCWPQHPHLVHEVAVLADQRRRAALDPTSSSLEEWHRYCVPNFLDRLRTRTKDSCDERHQPWPASGRFERHIGRSAETERGAVFAGDLSGMSHPVPDPSVAAGLHVVRGRGQRVGP